MKIKNNRKRIIKTTKVVTSLKGIKIQPKIVTKTRPLHGRGITTTHKNAKNDTIEATLLPLITSISSGKKYVKAKPNDNTT